jgi:hypothetical protein
MKHYQLLCLTTFLFFGNCITFPNYEATKGTLSDKGNQEKKIILLSYTQAAQVGDREKKSADESSRKISEDRFVRVLSLHPRVHSVVTDPNAKYDVKLSVDLDSHVSFYSSTLGMVFTTLSFLTGTLLPSDIEQDSTFTFQFTNEKTKAEAKITRIVHFNTWIGIFTIPLMPFYGLDKQSEKAFFDISHSALNEALEKQPKLF